MFGPGASPGDPDPLDLEKEDGAICNVTRCQGKHVSLSDMMALIRRVTDYIYPFFKASLILRRPFFFFKNVSNATIAVEFLF